MRTRVIKATPLKDYFVLLHYENGEVRKFNVKPLLNFGVFNELKEISTFNTVRPFYDTIEWANDIDIDPETLYSESTLENQTNQA